MPLNLSIHLSETSFMWGLPGKSCLTETEPEQQLDFMALTKTEQQQVLLGMRSKHIIGSVSFEDLLRVFRGIPTQNVAPRASQAPLNTLQATVGARAAEVLAQSLNNIKAFIKASDDLYLFRAMVESEVAGQKRRGLLGMLHRRIGVLEKAVHAAIIQNDRPSLTVAEAMAIEEAIVGPVTEEAEETITIRVGE